MYELCSLFGFSVHDGLISLEQQICRGSCLS